MLRATLKSLLGRKLRLALSALAVILGVMFVSGSFVLTDTLSRSFENMFDSAYAHTDVVVVAKAEDGAPKLLSDKELADVEAVTGVAKADGVAQSEGARVVGKDGKVVTTVGPPRLGANWIDGVGGAEIRDGHAPRADDEVVLNVALANQAGLHVGDTVDVLTTQPRKTFKLVGTFGYTGGLDGRGGVLEVRFTKPVAQQLMLDQPGAYTYFDVKAGPGQSPAAVRDAVQAKLGNAFEVKTGTEMAKAIADEFKSVLDGLNKVLLGFGGVALFVGIFLILNIFSITVAQRTKELALARALGASKKQMIGSVLTEALMVGIVGAVFGLGAGVGVGWVLSKVAAGMASLPLAPIAVPLAAVIAAVSVGVVITMIAALLPALRAARVPPIAALQEVATPDRPLTKLTVSGTAVTALGAALMGYGLTGGGHLWPMLGGVMFAFIGVALLSPVLGRPIVAVLGRLFSWSVAGRLGRLNSGRNPRRTAITAAALMIGIALITGASTILHSGDVSLRGTLDRDVKADLLVAGQESTDVSPTFAADKVDEIRRVPGVTTVTSTVGTGVTVTHGGPDSVERRYAEIVDDVPALAQQYSLKTVAGSMATPGANEVVVDSDTATDQHMSVGDIVTVAMPKGDPAQYKVTGVYQTNDFYSEYLFGPSALAGVRNPQPSMATITLAKGTDANVAKQQVAALVNDDPEITVTTRAEYLEQVSGQLGTLLTMVTVLLGLAIVIAVLGVIITLWLSVLERTRELGLLRAIGLGRSATMRMITVEAVVITLFGTLLGLGTGVGIGAAVVRSLRGDGITDFAVPWSQLGTYLAAGALVGVVAAVLPAIKAARTNVLRAIAYE